jgi:hypothetical protein
MPRPGGHDERVVPIRWFAGLLFVFAFALGVLAFWAYEHAGRLDQPVPATTPPAAGPDLTITFSPQFLTQLVRDEVERNGGGTAVDDLRVEGAQGRLIIHGTVRAPVSAGVIEAQPFTQQGRLQFRLIEGRVGPVPLPGVVVQALETELNKNLTNVLQLYPVTITGVEASEAGLTVTAKAMS